MRRKIIAVIKASRFYFLPMALLPYFIGAGMARHDLDMRLLWLGLGVQALVQISVSYLNDYWDIGTDSINTNRTLLSGGSGELTTGIIPPYVALVAGLLLQLCAVILAIIINIPAISWLVLCVAITLAHLYTMPPIKLVYRGLGELSVGCLAAFIVPSWGYSLQTEHLNSDLAIITLPLIPFVMGMMLGIAVPDYEADRQVGKNTLVVQVGLDRIASLYAALLSIGYVLAVIIIPTKLSWMALGGVALSFPLAMIAWQGLRDPVKSTPAAWLWMVMRPGLVTLVMVLTITLAVWL